MAAPTKRITGQQMTGQKGIALIQSRVLDMGFTWTPTGALEAGIDGYIEIRDDETGDVYNSIIQVQSKATKEPFAAETAGTFDYLCDTRDLDYWIRGNAPVILVVSRPTTNEAYWVSIKDYFRDPAMRQARKVRFDKRRQSFDGSCRDDLIRLAVPDSTGIYLAPPPRTETLISNLLPVTSLPQRLYIAETDVRERSDIWRDLKRLDVRVGGEWLLSNKRLVSVYDLRDFPWNTLCDVGTAEEFGVDEWADSDDPDRRREFVRLLNACLREKCYPLVRYSKARDSFYFAASRDLRPRPYHYQAAKMRTSRIVFRGYPTPDDPSYYRHSAFEGRFKRFDGQWYLEITPTYHFTYNGHDDDRYYKDRLAGIKKLERNDAVTGQLIMWAEFLSKKADLFSTDYAHLAFGQLTTFEIEAAIDDHAWLPREEKEKETVGHHEEVAEQLGLFSE
jgi:hypothetical protein